MRFLDDDQVRQKGYRFLRSLVRLPMPRMVVSNCRPFVWRMWYKIIPRFQVQTMINRPITLGVGLYEDNRYRAGYQRSLRHIPFSSLDKHL